MKRPRSPSLLIRLLVAYLLPTMILLGLFGWLAYRYTEKSLEESLGRRLIGIAQAAATPIRPETVLFLSPGDDDSRTARRLRGKLDAVRASTGVARIFVLDRQLRSRTDTNTKMRIGDRYYHAEADRTELDSVFTGRAASSVLFVGSDGAYYKTGYAPVLQGSRVVAAVGVEGSAVFFSTLARLRNTLLLSGGVVAGLVVLFSVLLARRITRPIRSLAREAARIGKGDLEHPIQVDSSDEVGLLASTMNEMREGLFQRDRQLQMMLSGIAHEVRNPLGGIALFSGILRDELGDDAEKLEHVKRIERELDYLKKVVGDFLDYARNPKPAPSLIELTDLTTDIVELLHKDAEDRGVTLQCDCTPPVPADCDPEQVRRVLMNLTRNAIQATPEGGQVRVRCGANTYEVHVEVQDTGKGIEPEVLDKIFEPFYTSREKGTGLGLAFAKKIVDEHGGTLTVSSEPGRGSTFRVTLPKGRMTDGNDTDH